MIDGSLRLFHVGVASNKSFIFPQLKMLRETNNFFAEERTRKNEHGSTFLEAMKVHMTRIKSFYKLKMLRHAQIQIVASQTSQKTADIFFPDANGSQKLFSIKMFFSKKWGQALCACVGPPGPPPFFGKKKFLLKRSFVNRSRL